MNGYWIPCGHNSYSFIPILSKLHWCIGHGLKICLWFGYNSQIIFISLFLQVAKKKTHPQTCILAQILCTNTSI